MMACESLLARQIGDLGWIEMIERCRRMHTLAGGGRIALLWFSFFYSLPV